MDYNEKAKQFTEELKIKGSEVVDTVKNLIKEGNVRKLIIKKDDDSVLFEIPLTAGVVAGGALTLIAPVLAAIGAGAALLTHVKLEVVRTDTSEESEKKETEE